MGSLSAARSLTAASCASNRAASASDGGAAAQPVRHPELAGRMRSVQFLGPLQQMLHPGVQQAVQFSGGQRRFDPFTDDNRDRHLRAKQLLGRSLVQIRCAPQTICGTIGTPASIAIRAAPS